MTKKTKNKTNKRATRNFSYTEDQTYKTNRKM